MPEYTATSQFILAHTDLSWNTVNPENQLIFKNPSQGGQAQLLHALLQVADLSQYAPGVCALSCIFCLLQLRWTRPSFDWIENWLL